MMCNAKVDEARLATMPRIFGARVRKTHLYEMKKASKELSEMTLQELWELFPIALVPHDEK